MKRPTTVDRVNARVQQAGEYLREFGWAQCTHGEPGRPADIMGALMHCAKPEGYEVVAARLLAARGFDNFWNDCICQNVFEARQALESRFDELDLIGAYGEQYAALVGIFRIVAMNPFSSLEKLARGIGPADEPVIRAAVERFPMSPAFVDAQLIWAGHTVPKPVSLMVDAMVANTLGMPDVDEALAHVLAPVAKRMGL